MSDVGIVEYSKDKDNNCIRANWFYLKDNEKVFGTGIAEGKMSESFEGEYCVTYFNRQGVESSRYSLRIVKNQDHYDLQWISDGQIKYYGIGIENDNKLFAGWRSC
jgi:hypothetical protein